MEPPDGAMFSGGWWHYRPAVGPLRKLTLTRSAFAGDYNVCWFEGCKTMTELLGPTPESASTIDLFPCLDRQSHR